MNIAGKSLPQLSKLNPVYKRVTHHGQALLILGSVGGFIIQNSITVTHQKKKDRVSISADAQIISVVLHQQVSMRVHFTCTEV